MKTDRKQLKSIDSQILEAINIRGHGSVFVPTDFLDLGSREAVDVVLHRLVRKGTIRRLARGIYDFPEEHPVLGWLQPSPEKIAEALVGRDYTRIQPTGVEPTQQTSWVYLNRFQPRWYSRQMGQAGR